MSWGSRTAGVPFCGEMIDVEGYNQVAGPDASPFHMGWSGGGNDLATGVAVVVAMDWTLVTAEPGDTVAIAWVITTTGTGTFTLKDGMDSSWNYSAAACTNDLGSHSLVTSGDTVIAAGGVTLAGIGGNLAQPQCLIEVTSGSIHVSQVKLRVWPPGGPVGGFSTIYPGYDSLPTHPTYFQLSSLNYSGQSASDVKTSNQAAVYDPEQEYYGALGAMRSALPPGDVTGWVVTNPGGVFAIQQAGTSLDGAPGPVVDFIFYGGAFAGGQSMGYFASFVPDNQVAVDPGPDFAPNPYYVPGDPASTKIETGGHTITWQNTTLSCQIINAGSDPMPTGFRLSVTPLGSPPPVVFESGAYKVTGVAGDMPPTVGSTIVPGGLNDNLFTDASLPIGNVYGATVSLFPLLPWSTPAYPGKVHSYSCSMSAGFNPDMTFTVSNPGYTVWSPSATTDPYGPPDVIPWGDFPPGYLFGPNPNLDGAGRGVDVNFA